MMNKIKLKSSLRWNFFWERKGHFGESKSDDHKEHSGKLKFYGHKKHSGKLKFHDTVTNCIGKIVDFIIEYFFFFRWPIFGYKNGLNNNLRIFSNLASAAMICCISVWCLKLFNPSITVQSILYKPSLQSTANLSAEKTRGTASLSGTRELNIESLLLIFAIIGAFFWDSRATYVSKWSYLAGLYNDVLTEKDQKIREHLRFALAQDLVHLGFYQHASFYSVFEKSLLESHIFVEWNKSTSKSKASVFIKSKLESKKFREEDINKKYTKTKAEELLENYQEFLLQKK